MFWENVFLVNTILLKFQNFVLKSEVCETGGNFWLQEELNWSVGYDLWVNVQIDGCFGLGCSLCTIFKICSQFLEIAIFEKMVNNPFFFQNLNLKFLSVLLFGAPACSHAHNELVENLVTNNNY